MARDEALVGVQTTTMDEVKRSANKIWLYLEYAENGFDKNKNGEISINETGSKLAIEIARNMLP